MKEDCRLTGSCVAKPHMAKKKPSRKETLISTDIPIREIRGQRVLLDSDLAAIYGVPTKRLNEAVKRNADRFPEDFRFQLTEKEWAELRSQIATGSSEAAEDAGHQMNRSQIATGSKSDEQNRSQIVTGSQRHRDPRHRPFAFTEHGALQAANVLKSKRAVAMSVYVIRAFVQMREQIVANTTILKRLAEIDKTLLEHDDALRVIWEELQPLRNPPPVPPKPRIGFRP